MSRPAVRPFLACIALLAAWRLPAGVGGHAGPGALRVLATTTLLASLASDVAAGRATVTSLLPVGASPKPISRRRPISCGSTMRA